MSKADHGADHQQTRKPIVAAAPIQLLVWTLSRPVGADTFATLAAAGVSLLNLPLIGTRLARRSALLTEDLRQAARDTRRIYVSVAAVDAIGRLAPELLLLPSAAVGPQTADALRAAGCNSIWQPAEGFGAEALLDLPQWAELDAGTITLLHAPGGQEAPFERLADQGLKVRKLQVYHRYRRRPSAASLARLRVQLPDLAWLAPSVAVVDALAELLAGDTALAAGFDQPLLVLSERIANAGRQRGFRDCRVVDDLQAHSLLAVMRSAENSPGEL